MVQITSSPTAESENFLLYDNECPFCSTYVRLVRLREAGVSLRLREGRHEAELVQEYASRGMNINDGMILHFQGSDYFGADAINRLALMSTSSGLLNIVNRMVFSNPIASRMIYPALRVGRNAILKALGRDPIGLGP